MARAITLVVLIGFASVASAATPLTAVEELGKKLFFDPNLSSPPGQSCASCHAPEIGWTGPSASINAAGAVMPGAVKTRFGNRKPPTVAYAGFAPNLHKCECAAGACSCDMMGGGMGGGMGSGMGGMGGGMGGMADRTFAGGLFWDGRATGWELDDPLAEQALGPFLNPLEMNQPGAKQVCLKVRQSSYADLFKRVWGLQSLDCTTGVARTYEWIGFSLAAFQRSGEVNPFTSKFDAFWRRSQAARPPVTMINTMNWTRFRNRGLDDTELQGLAVFNSKGNCSTCHSLAAGPNNTPPLFTDFAYHNLGVPKNPQNPFYQASRSTNPDGMNWIDSGLGGFLGRTAGWIATDGTSHDFTSEVAANTGRHRTPTLRNVDLRPASSFTKAFGHNGYFKSLEDVVHFYNVRDVLPTCGAIGSPGASCWPAPEVRDNINHQLLGDLRLTSAEERALVRFLKTLSDGFE